MPRSGTALNLNIQVIPGVIDPDYQGNIGITAYNLSEKEITLPKHIRIAQLIFYKNISIQLKENTNIFKNVQPTQRGERGFSSTGFDIIHHG